MTLPDPLDPDLLDRLDRIHFRIDDLQRRIDALERALERGYRVLSPPEGPKSA